MADVVTLKARVEIDNRDFKRELDNSGKAIVRFEGQTNDAGKKLQLLDRLAAAAGAGVARSFGVIAAGARGIATPFVAAGRSFDNLSRRAEAFNERVDKTRHKFEEIGKAAHTLATPLRVAGNAFSSLGNIAGNALAGVGTVGVGSLTALTAALAALGKRGVDVNLQLAGAQKTFEVLFKSIPVAADLMAQLRKESLSSAFEFVDLSKYAESLGALGFQAKEIIPTLRILGDTARGNSERMSRLVLAFGQIRATGMLQGDEAMQLNEAGIPVRKLLNIPQGKGFGDMQMSADVAIPQLLAGLKGMFGGLQAEAVKTLPGIMSNISDALNEVTSKAAVRLTAGLTRGAQNALDALNKAAEGPLGKSLAVIFDTAGKAVEGLTAKLPALVDWLAQVFTSDNIRMFFTNGIALAQTFGQTLADLFGVDLKKAMDPKNLNGWFEALGIGIKNGINAVFGFARVWKEVQVIIKGFWTDTRDALNDWTQDAVRSFRMMFLGLQVSIHSMAASIAQTVEALVNALNAAGNAQLYDWRTGKKIGNIKLFEIGSAGIAQSRKEQEALSQKALADQSEVTAEQAAAEGYRFKRDFAKFRNDPYRSDSVDKRISDAFFGRNGRDTSDQDLFWQRFQQNQLGVTKFFYQGSGQTTPAYPGGAVPGMFLGRTPGQPQQDPRVSIARSNVPAVPQFTPPSLPQWGGPPGYDPNDPYRPVTLPDGRTTTAYMAPYMPPSAAAVQGQAPTGMGAGSAGGPTMQVTNNQVIINDEGSGDLTLQDFEQYYRMYQQARQREQTQSGRVAPSRGFLR